VLAGGFVAVVIIYAVLARLWTDTDSAWYRSLEEPAWQPPDLVFAIIWPLNYLALLAVGAVLSWRRADVAGPTLAVLAVSVVFALGWSYLFSKEHALGPAAVALVGAASLTWLLLGLVARAGSAYAASLLVYTLWMTLAASLSIGFVALN
jgi:tryptophan-rich sensory protein